MCAHTDSAAATGGALLLSTVFLGLANGYMYICTMYTGMHSYSHSARSNVSMFCGFNTRAWDGHDGRLVGASYDVGGMVFAWVLWTSEVVS